MKKEKFVKLSKKRLKNSFKYAAQGIKSAFKTEQNLKIHFIITAIAIKILNTENIISPQNITIIPVMIATIEIANK